MRTLDHENNVILGSMWAVVWSYMSEGGGVWRDTVNKQGNIDSTDTSIRRPHRKTWESPPVVV